MYVFVNVSDIRLGGQECGPNQMSQHNVMESDLTVGLSSATTCMRSPAWVSAATTVSSITKMNNVEHLIPIRTLLIIRRNINVL